MHKLAQSVHAYVRKHDLLRPGDRAAIAVSGGADSVALLRLMLELRDGLGIVLSVVHLNHKLRAAESDADEQFVRKLAETNGLQIVCESRDVKSYAAEKKLSLETAGRKCRYEFFKRILEDRQADAIATAHTPDDQAETVLLKLSRGAGTRGIAGIYPKVAVSHQPSAVSKSQLHGLASAQLVIIRPLLSTRRSQLREYLAEIGQSWREDATNKDLRHTRNRIRHEILPRLEREVNHAVCQVMAETAEIARAEEEFWTNELTRFLPQIWCRHPPHALKLREFSALPLALRRRLVRAAAESLGLTLEFSHVEEILNLAHEGDRASLPGNWSVERRHDELSFQIPRETTASYQYQLSVPGKLAVPEIGLEIEVHLVNGAAKTHKYSPEHLVDQALVQHGLIVRNWHAGERFWPSHTKAPKKIKELLQEKHITGDEKQRWPVVACGDEIIWLRGFGVRRDFQAPGDNGLLIRETDPERSKK